MRLLLLGLLYSALLYSALWLYCLTLLLGKDPRWQPPFIVFFCSHERDSRFDLHLLIASVLFLLFSPQVYSAMYGVLNKLQEMRDKKVSEMTRCGVTNPRTWANLNGAYQRKVGETKTRFETQIAPIKLDSAQHSQHAQIKASSSPKALQGQGRTC